MTYKVEEVEGIGPTYGAKLNASGIATTDDLLEACASPAGRKSTAEISGLTEHQLLKWANMCDLMRISGVAGEYAELLEAAGVDTVKELRNRVPANLAAKMAEVNEQKKLVRAVASEGQVEKWVAQAKELPPKMTY